MTTLPFRFKFLRHGRLRQGRVVRGTDWLANVGLGPVRLGSVVRG
jgi:hypothetical protein